LVTPFISIAGGWWPGRREPSLTVMRSPPAVSTGGWVGPT
jgi:hypothetical protein